MGCKHFVVRFGTAQQQQQQQQQNLSQPKHVLAVLLGKLFHIPNDDNKQPSDEATGALSNLDRFERKPAMHPTQTQRPSLRKQDDIGTIRIRNMINKIYRYKLRNTPKTRDRSDAIPRRQIYEYARAVPF